MPHRRLDGRLAAAGVPGTVRGFELAHKSTAESRGPNVAPSVALARDGFAVSYSQARSFTDSRKLLEKFPESNRIFLRSGRPYEVGEVFRQPELASTLERIQRGGADEFYEGESARRLAAEMERHAGLITLADLKAYRAVERKPLEGSYKGYGILTSPPPSSGGIGILQMLGMLEGSGYEKTGAGSAATFHYLAEVMRRSTPTAASIWVTPISTTSR